MPTIFAVEDQPLSIMLIGKILRVISATLLSAGDGPEAISTYLAHPEIDLILMDLHLPSMSGLSLTETLRATPAYKARPIPIIAVTANVLMVDKKAFLASTGLDDYVTKPIHPEQLINCVVHHLRVAAARVENTKEPSKW